VTEAIQILEPTPDERRVTRGAAWLDRTYPNWLSRIELAMLDMRDGFQCVLAQASEEFDFAATCWVNSLGADEIFDYGFYPEGDSQTPLLNAWKTEIERRRQASGR
jgi:hypothetical protein